MVWHGMAWHGMVWYGMAWHGMAWYGMVWYGMVWYGMVWYGVVWYGMVWYGMTHVCVCKDEAGVRGSDLAALHLQRCCRRPLVRGGRSAAAAAVCLEFLQGKAYGRGEWGMLGWRADETREHGVAGERVDARGWYIRQAGAGDGGRGRVRSMSGVSKRVCDFSFFVFFFLGRNFLFKQRYLDDTTISVSVFCFAHDHFVFVVPPFSSFL